VMHPPIETSTDSATRVCCLSGSSELGHAEPKVPMANRSLPVVPTAADRASHRP
jgi:hypothetical protein